MELGPIALVTLGVGGLFGGLPVEQIVDSESPPPGILGDFFVSPSTTACAESVYFRASVGLSAGIYSAGPQGLAIVANDSIEIPGQAGTFQQASSPVCMGPSLLFLGKSDLSLGSSVFAYRDSAIDLVLERGTPINGSPLSGINSMTANLQYAVLDTSLTPASTSEAIVRLDSAVNTVVVADQTTTMPGQVNPVTIMSLPIPVGPDVVFRARTAQQIGIYRWTQGVGLGLLVDTMTPVPLPNQGTFVNLGAVVNLDAGIVFEGTWSGGRGLFLVGASGVEPLVLPGAITAEGRTLTAMEAPSGQGQLLSFTARTADAPFDDAIFVRAPNGELSHLVGEGEIIEGFPVWEVASQSNDRDVLVWVQTIDAAGPTFREFIYRARFATSIVEIPTLSTIGLWLLGGAMAIVGWRQLFQPK